MAARKTTTKKKGKAVVPDTAIARAAGSTEFASEANTFAHKFHAPQRRIIHHGLDELTRLQKDARRTAKKAFNSHAEADQNLEAIKTARETIPAVIPDDHTGEFQLDDVMRMIVATGLLVFGSRLLTRRDTLAKDEVGTKDIQAKIDDVEALRSALADQRDLFEYSGATKDDPEEVFDLLDQVLPAAQLPTIDDVSEWPFSWRQEASAWASAVRAAEDDDTVADKIPPRPSFLPVAKQLSLTD